MHLNLTYNYIIYVNIPILNMLYYNARMYILCFIFIIKIVAYLLDYKNSKTHIFYLCHKESDINKKYEFLDFYNLSKTRKENWHI